MEITLEKIELVKDRTGVSYREAKEALEEANGSVVEVLLYAIARHMIVGHEDAVQNLVSVLAIALIFIIRKYFFVPSFGHKMPGGKIAPDMEQTDAETPEAKAGDMAE